MDIFSLTYFYILGTNLNPTKKEWTALDPCAGSGTFVTILIKHVLLETINKTKKE